MSPAQAQRPGSRAWAVPTGGRPEGSSAHRSQGPRPGSLQPSPSWTTGPAAPGSPPGGCHGSSQGLWPLLLATPWVPRARSAGTTAGPSVHSVNKCGVLLCEGGQKPRERGSCSVTTDSAPCQALVLESGSGYEPVLDGTRCGKEQVSGPRAPEAATRGTCAPRQPACRTPGSQAKLPQELAVRSGVGPSGVGGPRPEPRPVSCCVCPREHGGPVLCRCSGRLGREGWGGRGGASRLRARPPPRSAGKDFARTSTCTDPGTAPRSAAATGCVGLWAAGDLQAGLRTSPGGQRAEAQRLRCWWTRRLGCSLLTSAECARLPLTCL